MGNDGSKAVSLADSHVVVTRWPRGSMEGKRGGSGATAGVALAVGWAWAVEELFYDE